MRGKPSILLIGESDVGKTHYGAQLLKRLIKGDGLLQMNGAASNLEPYVAALDSLNEGKAAGHTATAAYVESIWPIIDRNGRTAELIWPDYGGEQVKTIISSRRVPTAWRARILASPAWLLMIRLQQLRIGDDIFSRPLDALRGVTPSENREIQVSDQARLIELLQFLIYVSQATTDAPLDRPRLGILLTCWDELAFKGEPIEALRGRLPMFWDFVRATWRDPQVMGLSALGRSLSRNQRDMEYVAQGPEHFGYVVSSDGSSSVDLTLPLQLMLENLS